MRRIKAAIFLFLITAILVFAGCAQQEKPKPTPTPISTPTQTATPTPSPTPTETKVEEELHGIGTCDQCHDPPTVNAMAKGIHQLAFTEQPEIHKNLCSKCHDVDVFCGKCHEVPEVIKR